MENTVGRVIRPPIRGSYTDWTVKTNVFSYGHTAREVHIRLNLNKAATTTVQRNLGTPADTTDSWTLQTLISYPNWPQESMVNHGAPPNNGTGGQYLQLLDDQHKEILRFYSVCVNQTDFRLCVNTDSTILLKASDGTAFRNLIACPQLLTISAANGTMSVAYGAYRVSAGVYAPTAKLATRQMAHLL